MKEGLKDKYLIIIGGGPVGCYLAYKLLTTSSNKQVVLFESRLFERPQVIRIPFIVANDFPLNVKNKMWCDNETRSRIFDAGLSTDKNFWPKPDYSFWPWISISAFQTSIIDFLKTDSLFKKRFYFIPDDGNIAPNKWQAAIEKAYPNFNASIPLSTEAIFCTCGTQAKMLRQELNLLSGKPPEIKGHGIYLIYQNKKMEHYKRSEHNLSYVELGKNGVSYAAANNSYLDVQLYTYPEGNLVSIFHEIPEEFIQRAVYKQNANPLDIANKFNIAMPDDLSQIRVFYAPRTEYYWDIAASNIPWQEHSRPLFFLGDSAGSTDYKSGLSMGRGLLSVQALSQFINKHSDDFLKITSDFQVYWEKVKIREFNKGPQLSSEPWIQYHYLIKGRNVIYPDKTKIHYIKDDQYLNYVDEYQSLLPDFYHISEASAVLFVNTWALEENIQNSIEFAQSSQSKIIAVVKSDGYGLGVDLVSEIAIKKGIDFIAVAKLEEAVSIRNSGIPGTERIRIMVFETPLPQDIATYILNRIEMILPSDNKGNSIKILEEGLKNKPFLSEFPLKVHIMVDTGMRRDSGHKDSMPESILITLSALQDLNKNQVEFAGLATHLSCYRCTDYQGEAIIDYRTLQLQRFQEVVCSLLQDKIPIPLIHIGGGLALLGEQWSIQFESLKKTHGIELYTRVGHGLYGMELNQDLSIKCPVLKPVAELNIQVRNVFFIEENEPVSYGGLWRAPLGGVWIATLSGGWADGIPRTAQTLGENNYGMKVRINNELYSVVGKINMNAMMVNLGAITNVKAGDRAVIFGWRINEPKLNELAEISGQIGPSITVNIPARIPRIKVSDSV
ncbi:MAG: alanine racemase [Legionella longbeachae]|nr:alanine racemase [Legionella longbeachae]